MSKKSLILSSSGLKNLILNQGYDDKFTFHFGEEIFTTHKLLAEFICPAVSQVHRSDPTICDIYYDTLPTNNSEISSIFNSDLFSLLSELLKGNSIEISKEETEKVRMLSIILENDDLYDAVNKIYPINTTEDDKNIEYCMNFLRYYEIYKKKRTSFCFKDIVDQIANQFYSIDKAKLKKLSPQIIYEIISSEKLQLDNEDSLFEFIKEIQSERNANEIDYNLNDMNFYEQIEITQLTEKKFNEFLNVIDINQITNNIWEKLKQCFYKNIKITKRNKSRYANDNYDIKIEYDGNTNNSFRGIIFNLTDEKGGNVDDFNEVKITSSSLLYNNIKYLPKFAADFNDINFFHSNREQFSWLKYDFKDRKICPTHYSMKTAYDVNSSPRSWVLEVSNTGDENDWTILDTQNETTIFMPKQPVSHTFDIQQSNNEYYRYIRIRTTGKNNNNKDYFSISCVEFFGFIQQPK